uniref:Uncharacterized protein n=1 Tax=Opuntia streptacantha TaxID=393608 RepID=A0A7C9D6A3_OPUST
MSGNPYAKKYFHWVCMTSQKDACLIGPIITNMRLRCAESSISKARPIQWMTIEENFLLLHITLYPKNSSFLIRFKPENQKKEKLSLPDICFISSWRSHVQNKIKSNKRGMYRSINDMAVPI